MRGRTALAASVAVTALVVGGVVLARTGTTDREEPPARSSQPPATPEPATLASYDTGDVRVLRAPFCDRVSPTGIEHALGDVPAHSQTWGNGDRVRLPDGSRDRVQELGCAWTAHDGARAAAWLFVPPVDRSTARVLARERPAPGCTRLDGARLGGPSAAWVCPAGGGTEERYAGLLGDAWLTCSLTTPRDREPGTGTGTETETETQSSAWCVTVVEAARD